MLKILSVPAAFRPLLTKGLALSGIVKNYLKSEVTLIRSHIASLVNLKILTKKKVYKVLTGEGDLLISI